MKLSKNDLLVLKALQENSRLSCGKIAKKTGLSPQTVLNRKKFLEEKGVIKKYECFVDWRKIEFQIYELCLAAIPNGSEKSIFEVIQDMMNKTPSIKYFKYMSGSEQFVFGVTAENEEEIFKVNEKIMLKLKEYIEIKSAKTKEIISEYRQNKTLYY